MAEIIQQGFRMGGKAWHYLGAVVVVVVGVWIATAIANPIAGITSKPQ
jgi:hypothetical protein